MTNGIMTVEISRGTTHDGPGMRTTVFTKGCPLSCRWCQNPESVAHGQEVWYEQKKCVGCLECVKACPAAALAAGPSGIVISRGLCAGCGACADACPAKALARVGTVRTVGDLVREVGRDKAYYEEFGGGVTVSGGEPLLHADFIAEFFKALRARGINTAIDTCGYAPENAMMEVLPFADVLLYDVKLFDGDRHKELTGKGNKLILDNLAKAADYVRNLRNSAAGNTERTHNAGGGRGLKLWIRTPLIPGHTATEDNIGGIAGFIMDFLPDAAERWELCTFNAACVTKYNKMQLPWPYKDAAIMTLAEIEKIKGYALNRGFPAEKLVVTGLSRPG